MKKMSDKDIETMRKLQAQYKQMKRAEEAFLHEADERKNELLERWGISPTSPRNFAETESDEAEDIEGYF